ncbi:MAG: alpha/beta hydrolase [Planctomycetes bacterium]|nr:alpha/beta hydrolase [Planctomycetota bacterium]
MKNVTANGHEFSVFDAGTGSPIVFVHGFPLNHTMWQGQLDAFADSYRVIAPDLRGFGNSGVTEGTLTMEQFADDLNAILDSLGITEPITYCGLSMGGYIGWQFVRKYGRRIKTLILCDTRAAADSPEGIENRHRLAETVLEHGPEPALKTMLPNLVSEKTSNEKPELLKQLREMIIGTDRRSIAAALLGMSQRPDSTAMLAEITTPTLVIAGAEDKLIPALEMKQMAEAIPEAKFVEIPHAGHMAPMEDPQTVNDAMARFLESVNEPA